MRKLAVIFMFLLPLTLSIQEPQFPEAGDDPAWVTFLPSELDSVPVFMTELVDGDDYDLTIALPETCWTMTSFNLEPTYALWSQSS